MKYETALEKAKFYIEKLHDIENKKLIYQCKIAELALEVCSIKHGGRNLGEVYTLKRFAEDLGVSPDTLANWTRIYRNVIQKGSIKIESTQDWSAARTTNNILAIDLIYHNKTKGKTGCVSNQEHVSKEDVKELYDQIRQGKKPVSKEFISITQRVKNIKKKIIARDLDLLQEYILLELMGHLDEMSDHINDYLTDKKKRKAS